MTPTKSNYGQQRSAEVHARNAARKAAPAAPAVKTASTASTASTGRPAGVGGGRPAGAGNAPAMPAARPMKKGGAVIDGVAKKGKTKGKMVAMKRGGKC